MFESNIFEPDDFEPEYDEPVDKDTVMMIVNGELVEVTEDDA